MSNPVLLNPNDYVRITNDGDERVDGRYAGIDYVFKPGESVDVPLIVAAHIFGFGAPEQARAAALARLGWAMNSSDLRQAMQRLAKFKFSELPNVIELIPKKSGRAGPLGAGGTEGVGGTPSAPEDPLSEEDAPPISERI